MTVREGGPMGLQPQVGRTAFEGGPVHTLARIITVQYQLLLHRTATLYVHALWCVLQLFRAPRGRIQPLSQMGQDLQAHDRKWLEGLPRKQGTRSLETITETNSFRNGNRTRDLWKSTRVLLHSLAV